MDAHVNFGYSTVATAPSPATSGTSLVVAAGTGSRFPAVPFNVVIWPTGVQPLSSNAEIVRVTAISSDTFTISRTQENTSARTVIVGDQISAAATARLITDIETDLASADTQIALQAAQIECRRIADLGQFVSTGGALTVNGATAGSTAARLDMAASTEFMATTELTVAALTAQAALATANSTTVSAAANGNGAVTGTFAGSGVLAVASTTGFPSAGTLMVTHAGTVDIITYTGTTTGGTITFTGCTLVAGGTLTLSTSDTVVGTNADITNPRWAVIEIDSVGAWNVNLGTAAAAPAFPTITTTRTPHGFLYIPANATTIDTALTTVNGNAKLIDARNLKTYHPERLLFQDTALTSLSNPASLTTLLGTTYTIPANSLTVGDTFEIDASGRMIPGNTTDTAVQWVLSVGGIAMLDYTTSTLTKAANGTDSRSWTMHLVLTVRTVGASANFTINGWMAISAVAVAVQGTAMRMAGINAAAGGDMGVAQAASLNFDSTAGAVVDFKATRAGATITGLSIALRQFDITKRPV